MCVCVCVIDKLGCKLPLKPLLSKDYNGTIFSMLMYVMNSFRIKVHYTNTKQINLVYNHNNYTNYVNSRNVFESALQQWIEMC